MSKGENQWMVRLSEAEVSGPHDRSTMLRLIGQCEIPDSAQVCRVGEAEYYSLHEHPDFEGCFEEGSVEHRVILQYRAEDERRRATLRHQRLRRGAAVVALLGLAVGVPAFTIKNRAAVLPEEWFDSVSEVVKRPSPDEAEVRELPGDAYVATLTERWGANPETSSADLAQARAKLWSGSRVDVVEAAELLERLVVQVPDDIEVVGTLAETYARLLDGRPDLARPMMDMVDRADELAFDSVAVHRARASAAVSSRSWLIAKQSAGRCLEQTNADGEGDLGCEILLARATQDEDRLGELAARYPDAHFVSRLRLDSYLDRGDWAHALLLARRLAERFPNDATVWSAAGRSAAGVGLWDEALRALDESLSLEPDRVDERRLRGRIKLMALGDARAAREDFETVMRGQHFDQYVGQPVVWREAAAAHLVEGNPDAALVLADKALASDPDDAATLLYRAKALAELGERGPAEVALRKLRQANLEGRLGASVYTWSAHIFLEIEKKNAAMESLMLARSEDPRWPEVYLEGARIRFAIDDSAGAVDDILALGHLDLASYEVESPLVDVWFPRREWYDVERALSKEVRRQLQYGKDMRSVLGILALVTDRSNAVSLLQRATRREEIAIEERAIYAHGALAQLYIDDGQFARAEKHVDRVLADDSRNALFQGFKGKILSERNNVDGAMKSFERSMQQSKKYVGPYKWKAEAFMRFGKPEEALEVLETALELFPDDLEAQQLRLEVLAKLEEKD